MNQTNLLQEFSHFLYLKSLFVEESSPFSSIHPETLKSFFSTAKCVSPPLISSQSVPFPESTASINNILSSYQTLTSELSPPTIGQSIQPWTNFERSNKPQYRAHVNYHTAKPLREWWNDNIKNPYPDKEATEKLSIETGFSHKQIRDWFTNHRRRFEEKNKGKPLPWNKKATFAPYVYDCEQKINKS